MTRDFDDWQDSKKWKDLQDAGMIGVGRCYDAYVLSDRVNDLERYRKDHKETTKFNHGALCDILNRLKALEDNQHKHGHTEILLRIEKLEEFKRDYKSDGEVIKDLFRKYGDRLDKLEERKQAVDHEKFLEWQRTALTGGWKAVDKQVWEYIKNEICYIHIDRIVEMSEWNQKKIRNIIEKIKQVDPEWEPDK